MMLRKVLVCIAPVFMMLASHAQQGMGASQGEGLVITKRKAAFRVLFNFDFRRTFDLGLVRAYVGQGVSRLIVSGLEGGSAELPAMRDFVKRYQQEVIGKL